MLDFPKEYFESEVRDGFYVTSMMKKCWAAQLEILHDIDIVCRKYNIRWFADCGTLLGAVRHGGFIPWDDDLDICMLRDDYYRFLSIAKRELCSIWSSYDILNYHNEEYWEMISRVVNADSMGFGEERMEKFHGFPFSVGIDIFPLDYVCTDDEEEEARKELLAWIYDIAKSSYVEDMSDEQLQMLGDAVGRSIDRERSIKLQLYEIIELISSMFQRHEADSVALMPFWYKNNDHRYPLRLFDNIVMLPFENTYIQAPLGYHQVLRIEYGDYMRLVKTAGMHGYPYYDKQMKELEKRMGTASPLHRHITEVDVTSIEMRKAEHRDVVLFLPFKPSSWSLMEPEWRKAKERGAEVVVMPVPYYEKLPTGETGERLYNDGKYPDYVELADHRSYDLSKNRPDSIVIQYPYDDDDYATTIDPMYYSRNLRQYTDELIYIPYFVTDEICQGEERSYKVMEYYAVSPAVVCSDRVIVQSEQIKELYVKKLTETYGEGTRSIWERKLEASEAGKGNDAEPDICSLSLPHEWEDIVTKADGRRKKVIMYHISAGGLYEHGCRMLDKISSSMEVFRRNCEETAMLWVADPLIDAVLPAIGTDLYDGYTSLVEEYKKEDFVIYDDSGDMERAAALSDAYYGDASPYVQKCRNRKIPVMLQNVEV